jgi:hypothetical protein
VLSENDTKWIVYKSHNDVRETILGIRVGGLLLTEVNKHSLQLFYPQEFFDELCLRLSYRDWRCHTTRTEKMTGMLPSNGFSVLRNDVCFFNRLFHV